MADSASSPERSGFMDDQRSASGRIIALMNQKGGVGKTTTAVNLAAAIAHAGRRVCLVDLDPQAHLSLHLGIDPQQITRTVYDVLIDPQCDASDAIIQNVRPNLDCLPAEVDLAAAESELAGSADRQRILSAKFAPVIADYEFVFIDCPPSLGLLTLNALALAREVFVPMQAHFLALQGVGRLLETVGMVCQQVNADLRVTGIVLCMHEGQTMLAREITADLDAFFETARSQAVPWRDCRVLRPAIRRNIKLAEAPSFGKSIFDYAPSCPGAADYLELAQGLLAQREASPQRPRGAEIEIIQHADARGAPPKKTPSVTSAAAGAKAPTRARHDD